MSTPSAVPSTQPTFPLLYANIDGKIRIYDTSQFPNPAAVWWTMQEEVLGIKRPTAGRVSVGDMAAFIRDAVPLKHSHQPK